MKRIRLKKRTCLALGLVAVMVVLIIGIFLNSGNGDSLISRNSLTSGSQATDLSVDNNNTRTVLQCGMLVPYDVDSLMEKSHLIVQGKIVGKSDPFEIVPVFGDSPSIFTDYYLEADDVIRGSSQPGDTITIRVQGGTTENLRLIVEEAPDFQIGDTVIVFLYQPNMGGAYNTPGNDYYYVLGVGQGAFHKQDEDTFVSTYTNETLSCAVLTRKAKAYTSRNGIDTNWVYNDFLENQKRNLETGFISQEEYENLLAEAQEYAHILED